MTDLNFEKMPSGIYIDDTGTPGKESSSAFLHTNRKSWAAVVVPDRATLQLATGLEIFLKGIQSNYSAKELHFKDIYKAQGPFKGVSTEERYNLIDLVASIFEKFQLPIFFQTCSPEFISELHSKYSFGQKKQFWDLNKHEHFALLCLLSRVRNFIHEHKRNFKKALPVIVDEGLVKPGVVLELPSWGDVFGKNRVEFRKSHECPFLQLADFAASAIGRCQWLLGRGNLNSRDAQFLEIVSAERLCIINLPAVAVSPDRHTVLDYDEYLRRDRRKKGLPDDTKVEVRSQVINNYFKYGEEEKRWMDFIESKGELDRFLPRLNSGRSKEKTSVLSEIASAYILEKKLGYRVIDWEVETIDNKNVEFVIRAKAGEIYCEVKTPHWESELTKQEQHGDESKRKSEPKHKSGEGRWAAPWKNIRYAIEKSNQKFLSEKNNMVVINDNLFVSIFAWPENIIDIALYEKYGCYNNEKGYFADNRYENVGGIFIWQYEAKYQYKFLQNKNAKNPFILDVK